MPPPSPATVAPGELPGSIRVVGESKHIFLLVFGMWGCGKTVLVGSGGPKTLILRPPTDHTDSIIRFYPPEARPKEWIIHDWDQMDEAKQYLKLHGQEWGWVWLDSLSLWQDTGLDDIWAAVLERRPERGAKHAGMDKGEYGRNMERIAQLIRDFVGMDTFHFGITAHPTTKLDTPAGERKMMPWVQGSMMSEKICGYMNMVGYMEVKVSPSSGRRFRQLTFQETADYYAKDQFNAFDNFVTYDPTLEKIVTAVTAAKNGQKAATPGGRRGRKGA